MAELAAADGGGRCAARSSLVSFWTYSCINCLRAIPYVRAWAKNYRDQGLVVIGVHTPEFAFEKTIGNVEKAVTALQVDYPVAIDNDFAIWRAFYNHYWPALYVIDPKGHIRYHHFGEGEYERGEQVIRQLLAEAGQSVPREGSVAVKASGAEAASDVSAVGSPETYLGFAKAENFISPGGLLRNGSHRYDAPPPRLNQWALSGKWTIGEEHALLDGETGSIVYRFRARDLHLVLGAADGGKPVRFRVRIDGAHAWREPRRRCRRPMAPGRSPTIASTSWCAKAVPSWTIRSRSNSSIPVFKPTPSPSVDWETSHDRT